VSSGLSPFSFLLLANPSHRRSSVDPEFTKYAAGDSSTCNDAFLHFSCVAERRLALGALLAPPLSG
jgi:hypothetical protein